MGPACRAPGPASARRACRHEPRPSGRRVALANALALVPPLAFLPVVGCSDGSGSPTDTKVKVEPGKCVELYQPAARAERRAVERERERAAQAQAER